MALQRLYSPARGVDVNVAVHDGDLMLVPWGYHTTAAAHGYDLYYLNALAGDRGSMAAADDPALASDPAFLARSGARSPGAPRHARRPALIRLANAPVSYGAFELTVGVLPNVAGPEEVHAGRADAGYEGIEFGPPGYLGDQEVLRARLERFGLSLAGGFIQVRFSQPEHSDEDLAAMTKTLDLLAAGDRREARPVLSDFGSRFGSQTRVEPLRTILSAWTSRDGGGSPTGSDVPSSWHVHTASSRPSTTMRARSSKRRGRSSDSSS